MPAELDIHIVMDNDATHKTAAIRNWLARRPRWHVHFTPTGASWLNMVERFLAEITDNQIRRGVHGTAGLLGWPVWRVAVVRNRNGRCGAAVLGFDAEAGRFFTWEAA